MGSYSTPDIIKTLKDKNISCFSLTDFARVFHIDNEHTLYKKIQRLEEKQIIRKIIKGKYLFLINPIDDFTVANFAYKPSYISLESALSFYGIISGFSYMITSVTVKKTRSFTLVDKEFQYAHIQIDLFWGYEKKEDFLIAQREKALLDYIYFTLKGLRTIAWDELSLKEIDKQKFIIYAKQFNSFKLLSVAKGLL